MREPLRGGEEEPDYIGVLQQRAGNLNIKRLLFKENHTFQVKEFSAVLLYGKMQRVWAH